MNNDHLSDEDLLTLYARLSLAYNHLPDRAMAAAIARDIDISTDRLRQIGVQIQVAIDSGTFVTDRLSNEELSEAALEYCRRNGLMDKELSQADWISISRALRISTERFRVFANYISPQLQDWRQRASRGSHVFPVQPPPDSSSRITELPVRIAGAYAPISQREKSIAFGVGLIVCVIGVILTPILIGIPIIVVGLWMILFPASFIKYSRKNR